MAYRPKLAKRDHAAELSRLARTKRGQQVALAVARQLAPALKPLADDPPEELRNIPSHLWAPIPRFAWGYIKRYPSLGRLSMVQRVSGADAPGHRATRRRLLARYPKRLSDGRHTRVDPVTMLRAQAGWPNEWRPALRHVIRALGGSEVGRLLSVNRSSVVRWGNGQTSPDPKHAMAILRLYRKTTKPAK